MTKLIINEKELIMKINQALEEQWEHAASYCRIEELRKSNFLDSNWEVAVLSTGGLTLDHAPECSDLQKNVLHKFVDLYNVGWSK